MDVRTVLDAPCTPDEMFRHVEVLDAYPAWMTLVHATRPTSNAPGESVPVWQVELRARVGPLARSKRLRMARTHHDPVSHSVTFERAETDGRTHSPWVLRADVAQTAEGCHLEVQLHYGGGLWTGGLLERALSDQIEAGRQRLLSLVSSTR
jgi:hypothetical protein